MKSPIINETIIHSINNRSKNNIIRTIANRLFPKHPNETTKECQEKEYDHILGLFIYVIKILY